MNPRRRRNQPEPESTSDLMAGLLSRLGGSGRALEYRVFDAYAQAAGALFRAETRPDAFRGGTLFVSVSSAALGHELTLLRVDILARMAETLGAGVVTELRTRMG
jgi:hypothetical protein